MWKREGEDWIERRGGRGYATEQPGTLPPVTLPASTSQGGENTTTTTTQALAAGFVPPHFHDEPPKTPYAGQPGKQTVTTAYDALRKEDKYRKNRRDLCWVTLLGIAEDQVMNIRDYIDTFIGRTTGHYVPAGRVTHSNTQSYNACSPSLRPCYLQFASHVVAAQVVHAGVLRVELALPHQSEEKKSSAAVVAAAAEGGSTARRQRMGTTIRKSKLAVHAEAAGFVVPSRKACNDDEEEEDEASEAEDSRTNMPSYLEVAVSWCTDETFLRQRDRMSTHGRREEYSDGTSATHGQPINENNAGGLKQQTRHHSNNAREQSEHNDDDEEDASQTARSVTMTYRDNGNSSNNNNYESVHAYGANGSNREVANGVQDAAQLQQRNSKTVRQADEGRRSALKYTTPCDATASVGNMSVLSLFYTQSTSNVWHVVLRCLLIIPITLFRLLALLTGKWTQHITPHTQQPQNKTNDADTTITNSIHMYRQCHSRHDETLMDNMSMPALQDIIATLFYRCIPFAPTTEEVDLALWAFKTHRTLMADDELARLQEHLRAIAYTNAAGALNVNTGKHERQSRRGQGLNVLCIWRPVWWFTRYTLLSMLVVIGLAAYIINISDKKSNESYTL